MAWEDTVQICLCCIPHACGGNVSPSIPVLPRWELLSWEGNAHDRQILKANLIRQKVLMYEALLVLSVCKVGWMSLCCFFLTTRTESSDTVTCHAVKLPSLASSALYSAVCSCLFCCVFCRKGQGRLPSFSYDKRSK